MKDRINIEHCVICDEPTGNSGGTEDSLYAFKKVTEENKLKGISLGEEIGPLCTKCLITLDEAGVIE